MVELSTRKRKIRGDGGNHQQKLGLKIILSASHFTIPYSAGKCPHPAGNNINTGSAKTNQASHTPDFSYPLVCSISLLSLFPITLCLVHNSTIIARTQCLLIHFHLSIHDHEFTPSSVYTECTIQRVQHTPRIVCRPFIFMITSWLLNIPSDSSIPPYRSNAIIHFSISASKVQSPWHFPTVLS